jgi:hypothetical protein
MQWCVLARVSRVKPKKSIAGHRERRRRSRVLQCALWGVPSRASNFKVQYITILGFGKLRESASLSRTRAICEKQLPSSRLPFGQPQARREDDERALLRTRRGGLVRNATSKQQRGTRETQPSKRKKKPRGRGACFGEIQLNRTCMIVPK